MIMSYVQKSFDSTFVSLLLTRYLNEPNKFQNSIRKGV